MTHVIFDSHHKVIILNSSYFDQGVVVGCFVDFDVTDEGGFVDCDETDEGGFVDSMLKYL